MRARPTFADAGAIARGADILRGGGLVALPTETVYGLGADARNPAAVARVFSAKGRPADHPLIVHLADATQVRDWAREVPGCVRDLAKHCWPGPLTLVLKRAPGVLDAVTGGQDTVALRVPAHPIAQALLREFGDGTCAPSANRFGRISPTEARHVAEELGDAVDLILDGGACTVGIESTILDLSTPRPRLLRPGALSADRLSVLLGERVLPPAPARRAAPVACRPTTRRARLCNCWRTNCCTSATPSRALPSRCSPPSVPTGPAHGCPCRHRPATTRA